MNKIIRNFFYIKRILKVIIPKLISPTKLISNETFKKSAEGLKNIYYDYFDKKQNSILETFVIGKIYIGDKKGLIQVNDKILIEPFASGYFEESSSHDSQFLTSMFHKKISNNLHNAIIICTSGSENYYHFIFDSLTKYLRIGGNNDECPLILSGNSHSRAKEILRALNINNYFFSSSNYTLQVNDAIVPMKFINNGSPSKYQSHLLRESFKSIMPYVKNPSKFIYISRSDSNSRRIINELDLTLLLVRYGFDIIKLSDLSFIEQLNLFANASIVLGSHGAGFTNIIFCNEKTSIIELFSEQKVEYFYKKICFDLGFNYSCLVFPSLGLITEDFIVDLSDIEDIIEQSLLIQSS